MSEQPEVINRINGVAVIEHKEKYNYLLNPYIVSDGWLRRKDDTGWHEVMPAYEQIICECGEKHLQILYTNSYETSAYCEKCDRLWTVHEG